MPCADTSLLVPLKRSRLYGAIRPRVAERWPVDSWQQDGLHLFVFLLNAEHSASAEPPVAVFAMHPELKDPLSAVIVTPRPNGAEAEIMDLSLPENVYTAALA